MKTFILQPFANNLVILIISAILVSAAQLAKPNLLPKISLIIIYKKDISTSNTKNKTFKYPSHNQDSKARFLLKKIVSNLMVITKNLL